MKKVGPLATYWTHSEDSDQTGQMPRLILVFAEHTLILLVFFMSQVKCYTQNFKTWASFSSWAFFTWWQNWAASWQNQQNDCVPSETASTQYQPGHLPSLIRVFAVGSVAKDSSFLHVDSEDSDQTQSLSLRWAHMLFFLFCHEATQIFSWWGSYLFFQLAVI